jgi:hypothetical protein
VLRQGLKADAQVAFDGGLRSGTYGCNRWLLCAAEELFAPAHVALALIAKMSPRFAVQILLVRLLGAFLGYFGARHLLR